MHVHSCICLQMRAHLMYFERWFVSNSVNMCCAISATACVYVVRNCVCVCVYVHTHNSVTVCVRACASTIVSHIQPYHITPLFLLPMNFVQIQRQLKAKGAKISDANRHVLPPHKYIQTRMNELTRAHTQHTHEYTLTHTPYC